MGIRNLEPKVTDRVDAVKAADYEAYYEFKEND